MENENSTRTWGENHSAAPSAPRPDPWLVASRAFTSAHRPLHAVRYHWQIPKLTEFVILISSLFLFSPVPVRWKIGYIKSNHKIDGRFF